jgi:hypothetical protein
MFRPILAILKGKNLYILVGTQAFTSLGIVTLHYDKILAEITVFSKLLCQQMHSLLKHKMLQLTLKISLYMAPTCFGPFGPSSGSIRRNLATVTVFVELLVKIHRQNCCCAVALCASVCSVCTGCCAAAQIIQNIY